MRIGIDFDNTIVDYDRVFHRVALEGDYIPVSLPESKIVVRDYLRLNGKEDIWTEMQGTVYGARMNEAAVYPGFLNFLCWTRDQKIETHIISHKTRHPFLGQKHNLHESARQWIEDVLKDAEGSLIDAECVHLEITKSAKLARVAEMRCDYFVDDLPEILSDPAFPPATRKILFDPQNLHEGAAGEWLRLRSWGEVGKYIEVQWTAVR